MKIEKLKKSLEFAEEFLSKEEFAMTMAAIDLATIAIEANDCIVNSDNQIVMKDFQDKIDGFLYFLQDDD